MSQALLDALRPWLDLAALAPSSHNCQPWRVTLCSPATQAAPSESLPFGPAWPHALRLDIDPQRRLRALPALDREMLLSLGGFAAILLNLLRHAGWSVRVHEAGSAVPRLFLMLGSQPDPAMSDAAALQALTAALRARQTERGLFLPEQPLRFDPSESMLRHGLGLPSAALRWHRVDSRAGREALAQFFARHAARDLLDRLAWSETYAYLDFSGRAARPGPDGQRGIAIERLFGPMGMWRRRGLQCALHPAIMGRVGRRGWGQRVGAQFAALVRSTPAHLCLGADSRAPSASTLLQAGARVADLWLTATCRAQALHPLSVAVQHEDLRSDLADLLGCRDEPLFIARVGTPMHAWPANSHRRLPADRFCVS